MKKLITLLAALSLQSQAATVTSTADGGPGSLREAIANAAAGETITFSLSGTITLTSGELRITNDLIILGPGATNLTVQRSTETNTPDFRIFNVQSGSVSVSGLTVSNGHELDGGGIQNGTTLTLRDCAIEGNVATHGGGGINNTGTLTMSNCVACGNFAAGLAGRGGGGGIFNLGTVAAMGCIVSSNTGAAWGGGGINTSGLLMLTNSVITGNSARGADGEGRSGGGIYMQGTVTVDTSIIATNSANGGGGIFIDLGTLNLVRSTVCGNSAEFGAGIMNENLVIVENSTVSGNVASSGVGGGVETRPYAATGFGNSTVTANVGGGSFNFVGYVAFWDSILAGNTGGADVGTSAQVGVDWRPGRTESYGFNVVGSTNGVITPATNDQFNVTAEMLRLGPLQDNGGPTFTHALLCGSAAINAGDSSDAPATDQRGFPRIMGGTIDIGAYESGNQPGKLVNADGCTLNELCPCVGAWRNHGDYITCIIVHAWEFYRKGLISLMERQTTIRDAALGDCGKQGAESERVRMHTQPQTPLEIWRDGFRFILSGEIPGRCVLESSSDLVNWSAIQTNQVANTEMEIADPDVGQASVRFYRVRVIPQI